MGYYTSISIQKLHGTQEDYEAYLDELANDLDEPQIRDYESCTAKWYSVERVFIERSKKHPDLTVELYGEGEEAGDIWKERINNGRAECAEARIIFDDFKEIM